MFDFLVQQIRLRKKIKQLEAEKKRLTAELQRKQGQIDVGSEVLQNMQQVLSELLRNGDIESARSKMDEIGEIIKKNYPYQN